MFIWMGVVFCLSTDFGSAAHTGSVLKAILRWIDPAISGNAIEQVHFVVRKAAHVTVYAILAVLALRGFRCWRRPPVARWSWSIAALALITSAAYGATDEFHQTFVPSRGPSVHDVVVDSCGAVLGLALAFWWTRATREKAAARAE